MRSKKSVLGMICLVICAAILVTLLLLNTPENTEVWSDVSYQYNLGRNTSGQISETISFICTIFGIVLAIAGIRIWMRYRNERDAHYWNGGYETIPEDFTEDGKIHGLSAGRCGGGRSAMMHTRDFHQTAAAFLPPTKGQPTSTGFWRIY